MRILSLLTASLATLQAAETFFIPSQEQFNKAVAAWKDADGKTAPKPSDEAYQTFVKYASGSMLAVEQAMFLTHVIYGTMGLQYLEEIACKGVNEVTDKCPNGKYHGRGYIMLSTEKNYKAASRALYDNPQTLLDDPVRVLDQKDAWRTALWFWNRHVRPSLMMNEGLTKGEFGWSVRQINGVNECPVAGQPPKNADGAKKRLELFNLVKKELGVPGPDGNLAGCM